MEFEIKVLEQKHRGEVDKLLKQEWGELKIVSHGKIFNAHELQGYVAVRQDAVIGFVLFQVEGSECEIVALYSGVTSKGIGSALINAARDFALQCSCKRLFLITTNDNIRAFEFYQKRGFVISDIRIDEIKNSRKLKPQIPIIADNGIPIRDEIEFEIML